jgi:transcriptional regulator PpsR
MPALPTIQPDITLLLDMEGVIREATLSAAMNGETVDGWLGRAWVEVAGEPGGDKVRRMVDDARVSGISAFRQINQRFPSGLEIPLEFTIVLLGGRAGMLAIGKNLQAVAELQSRLIAAQQTMERDYWKQREIETRYRLVFDASNEAVMIVSAANLRIIEANRTAIEAMSFSRRRNDDFAGGELLNDIAADDREAVRDMLARLRERGKALSILVHFGAAQKPWMLRGSLISAEAGHVFLLQFTAVSNLPVAKEGRDNSPVEQLIDHLPDAFVALDDSGLIGHANQAFLDLVQVGCKGSVIGQSLGRWLSQPGADLNALLINLQRHKTVRLFTTSIRGDLGTDTEVEISAGLCDGYEPSQTGVLLRNVARRLASSGESDLLRNALASMSEQIGKSSLRSLVKNTVSIVEQHYVKEALELAGGNRTATAELLGLSRQSLYAKLNRYGLDDKLADTEQVPGIAGTPED